MISSHSGKLRFFKNKEDMNGMRSIVVLNIRIIRSFLFGALAGYLILHPYVMIVNYFTESGHGEMRMKEVFMMAFNHMTLPMAIPFILFGGLLGLMIEGVLDRQSRLSAVEAENQRKRAEIETLQRLMITISHYLLNANAVIGGMAARCNKLHPGEEFEDYLSIIKAEARRIDAVVKALRRITEIKTADYTSRGHGLMIDISKELEALLQKTEEK
jgi:signal transduction histidine kinase